MASVQRLPSGKWRARVVHPSGRRLSHTDRRRGVVEAWARDTEDRIAAGQLADPRARRLTFAEHVTAWRAERVVEVSSAARDLSHLRAHLAPHWDDWPVAAITRADVRQWIASMQRDGVRPPTIHGCVRLLGTILDTAVEDRLITENPARRHRLPTISRSPDRIVSPAEHEAMVAAAGPWRDLVEVMPFTGLRWAELAGLHVHRLDLLGRQLHVVETLRRDGTVKPHPKSSAGRRTVPLTDHSVDALARAVGSRRGGLVFVAPRGGPLIYNRWRARVWVPMVTAAGLAQPLPTPHDMRHTCGTRLAEAGVPMHEIAAFLGHSSTRSTERYVHATDSRHDRARRALAGVSGHLVDTPARRARIRSPLEESGQGS